jgi:ubiquinone/menaquinone biosynthesis C-methylase UbiE
MEKRKQETQAYFDEIGRQYGALYEPNATLAVYPSGPMREQKALRLMRQLAPGGQVLDCGCGTGHFACALAGLGYQVAGIDLSATMVEQSRAYAAGQTLQAAPTFAVGDCEKLDAADHSLDAVTSLGVIEYLSSDDAIISEIARVLKPDGVAVIAFRNRLFNLFSANPYTQAEIDRGEFGKLLAEYQAEAASFVGGAVASAGYREFAATLAQQAALAAVESGRAAGVSSPIPRPVPIALRQHTPAGARAAMASAGFQCLGLLYFHFHPFPPGYEAADAQVFNRLGIAMEALDQTPIGAMMASAFVAAFGRIDV